MGRPSVNRVVQVAKETTPGTPVAASKLLPSMSITLTRELDVKQYRAMGFKAQTIAKIVKDFCSGKMTGPLNYTELVYALATLVTPVITTPTNGILTRQWVFTGLAVGADSFNALTIQEGDGTAALQASYGIFTEFGVDIKLDSADISGSLIGQNLTATTLTGAPTSIVQKPIGPREIDVFMDAEGGTIGTTKITDAIAASWKVTNKQAAKWVLNTSNASFKETIEVVPSFTGEIETEHNSQSRTLFASISALSNPTQLIRIAATGPLIEAVTPNYFYSLNIDFPAQVIATEQTDSDGVWGYKYSFLPIYSSVFGNIIFRITLITTLTAL